MTTGCIIFSYRVLLSLLSASVSANLLLSSTDRKRKETHRCLGTQKREKQTKKNIYFLPNLSSQVGAMEKRDLKLSARRRLESNFCRSSPAAQQLPCFVTDNRITPLWQRELFFPWEVFADHEDALRGEDQSKHVVCRPRSDRKDVALRGIDKKSEALITALPFPQMP